MKWTTRLVALLFILYLALPASARVANEKAERTQANKITLSWSDQAPVDVYICDSPEAPLSAARLVSRHNRTGRYEITAAVNTRPFFALKDIKDSSVVRTAERLVPLEQGSNFRDLGGYAAADGRHVRWGLIYRSGATPLLTDADVAQVQALRMRDMIDLRSSEERQLAPTRIQDVRYSAVDYSFRDLIGTQPPTSGESIYKNFPTLLAPQLRILFHTLLADQGPLVYNCSAGQDRTGFASAMVLSALGVSRDDIYADYLLSTLDRRPQFELPKLDPSIPSDNPIAAYFARAQQDPRYLSPRPLLNASQRPFLETAFTEIDDHWGSVDNYLTSEIGLSAADIAKLRSDYLE